MLQAIRLLLSSSSSFWNLGVGFFPVLWRCAFLGVLGGSGRAPVSEMVAQGRARTTFQVWQESTLHEGCPVAS